MEARFKPRRTGANSGLFPVHLVSLVSAELCEMVAVSHSCSLPASQIGRGQLQIFFYLSSELLLLDTSAYVNICEGQADCVSEQIKQDLKISLEPLSILNM